MPKKEVNKTEKKEKKHFFRDFKAELKRVIWPTPKQLVNNTVAVITIVLITALIVFVLDFAFESINRYGINNLKGMVETYQEEHKKEDTTNNENTNNTNSEGNSEQSNNETANNEENTNNTVENNTEKQ